MVKVNHSGIAVEAFNKRYPLRLGADVFARGAISDETCGELLRVFESIADEVRSRDVERYRAVATSAMREARNGVAVVNTIAKSTGIRLDIISGEEEGRLAKGELLRALGTVPPDTLLIDLGGGSLEIERASGPGGQGVSLPLGTVRLIERFPSLRERPGAAALEQYVSQLRGELAESFTEQDPATLAIGSGGNLDTLARLAPKPRGAIPCIDFEALRAFGATASELTSEERIARYGIRADRADLILAAICVIRALAEHFSIETLAIPGAGIRQALLHELLTQTPSDLCRGNPRWDAQPTATRNLVAGRLALGEELFKALAPMFGLWPNGL
jgi:exopolyphosphatase/guanosine-5'-triphosphate,3'-diphosphate pyrophosphatase